MPGLPFLVVPALFNICGEPFRHPLSILSKTDTWKFVFYMKRLTVMSGASCV